MEGGGRRIVTRAAQQCKLFWGIYWLDFFRRQVILMAVPFGWLSSEPGLERLHQGQSGGN